ncbi:hypothetical protein HAX54_010571, partial [Datura stramonium]|nr:hypothetical protein [Datura stramonium]
FDLRDSWDVVDKGVEGLEVVVRKDEGTTLQLPFIYRYEFLSEDQMDSRSMNKRSHIGRVVQP